MKEIDIVDDKIVIGPYSPNRPPQEFPVELLDQILALPGSTYSLDDALWFRGVTRGSEDFRWVTVEELVAADEKLVGYNMYYWSANWEDSCWESIFGFSHFKLENVDKNDVLESWERTHDVYHAYDEDGEEEYRSFSAKDSVLIVKQ